MPYTVSDIIHEQEVVCVSKENTVLDALSIMTENDFSQLPVIDEMRHPLGLVTYESILKGLRNFNLRVEELKVSNVMSHAYFFHLEDTLSDLLERLKSANGVLILGSDSTIAGIVTTYDATEYFRRYAEDLMLVEDIESMTKDLIRLIYAVEEDESDSEKLREAITNYTGQNKVKTFDKLTFGNYMHILLAEENWPTMQQIFDMPSSEAVRNILDGVRRTRNDLAHFQGEITSDQRDQLQFCVNWLSRCQSEYEERVEIERQNVTVSPTKMGTMQDEIAEEPLPTDSRYSPLADWLNSQPGSINQVKFTFSEVEEIIGGDLPTSAFTHRAWWANDSVGHPHSKLWLEVGWRRSSLNMSEKIVAFVRIKEREKSYIDFFNKLVATLNEKADFSLREISPDGQSWIVCQSLSTPGAAGIVFSYSFARGNRFRIELYIDVGDQATNKEIFDLISTHQSELEGHLGEISWERIDNKKASRIALYHSGSITQDSQKLAALREWAVDKMVIFYKTIEPIATQAAKKVLNA